jgi:hypothetical protein
MSLQPLLQLKRYKYYTLYVFVASGTQHAICMRHIFIYGFPCFTVLLPHYLINNTIFEKELLNIKCVVCFSL